MEKYHSKEFRFNQPVIARNEMTKQSQWKQLKNFFLKFILISTYFFCLPKKSNKKRAPRKNPFPRFRHSVSGISKLTTFARASVAQTVEILFWNPVSRSGISQGIFHEVLCTCDWTKVLFFTGEVMGGLPPSGENTKGGFFS